MKRRGNLYSDVCSIENLELADKKARTGKGFQRGIVIYDQNRTYNTLDLHYSLVNKTFTTSPYKTFTIIDNGKEREIFSLPYRDRIVHHAVANYIEPIFVSTFTADTYSCIKTRGTLKASMALREALKDVENTTYCLKLDIKKFYPNIDHDILKAQVRRKIKDQDLLWLLDDVIDSGPGAPIGNLLSQYFANIYLTPFDHWIKSPIDRVGGGGGKLFQILRRSGYTLKQQRVLMGSVRENKNVFRCQLKVNSKIELADLSGSSSWNRFCGICTLPYSCEIEKKNKEKICQNAK